MFERCLVWSEGTCENSNGLDSIIICTFRAGKKTSTRLEKIMVKPTLFLISQTREAILILFLNERCRRYYVHFYKKGKNSIFFHNFNPHLHFVLFCLEIVHQDGPLLYWSHNTRNTSTYYYIRVTFNLLNSAWLA